MRTFYHLIIILLLLGLFHPCQSVCTFSTCSSCPCFGDSSESISLSEDSTIGSSVFTFAQINPSGASLSLMYSIRTNPPPDEFQIDSRTGELTVAQELDYETTQRYTFRVGVENTDGRDTIEVNIELTNVDDNPTVCAESIVVLSVIEEQSVSDLELPGCTDNDVPSSPSFDYSIITGNETGLFVVNGGNISLLRPLDYEVQTLHDLSISVVQSGGTLNFNMTVIIKVVPVNEYTPQFASSTIYLSVSESANITSTIGQIAATDNDVGNDGTIIYSILSQSSNEIIIHPNTGEVIVARTLDYETVQSYSLTVVARDSPTGSNLPQSSTAQVQISIQDANDNRPFFTSYVYYVGVSEQNGVDYEVAHVQCNDSDASLNGEVTYSIVAGNQEGKFQVNATSGQVALAATLDYDNNNTQFYNLTIECREVQPPQGVAQTSLLVSVESFNEFRPDPGADYRASVPEDTSPGTPILQVMGRDRDSGLAGKLTYSINDGTPYCPERIVYIDQVTGVIYLNAPLDYESGLTLIYCTILAQDSEQPVHSNIADLRYLEVTNVNDVAPVCDPPMFNASIQENSAVGTEVLTLLCSDADSLILNYFILDALVPFQISSSGSLTVNDSLDYETNTFHRIPIEVSDGEFSFNTTVFVNILGINEHPPAFAQAMYICSVNENEAIGSLVCTVSASDYDSGSDGTVYYQISTGTPRNSFIVDQGTGQIYLAASIDYESEQSFSFTIEAYDLGEPSLTASASVTISAVDLNDNHPHMESFAFFDVSETAALGERIATLNCTDVDSGLNGQLTYQLNSIVKVGMDGSETLVTSNPFTLDSSTGDLTVNTNLDYETDQLYRFSVGCRDNGTPSLVTFSTVAISVQPENEYTPSFSQSTYFVDVSESSAIGSSISMVSASDSDAGVQGDIFYLIEISDSLPFAVNPHTGVISLVASLDCLQNLTYTLIVIARDGGSPPLQSQASVDVNIINCHLGSLVPQESIYVGSVEENSPSGTAVLTVACNSTRNSLSSSYSPKYRISDSHSSVFQVDEDSGLVSVSIPPDFEAEESHLLTLQCFDENHPQISADIHTYISIYPINEHAPEFNEDPSRFSIAEGTPLGSIIFAIVATDLDSGRDGQITYSIGRNDSDHFFIDPHSGEVYLVESLDRESQDELTITVSAHDNPEDINSRRMSVSTINIQVTDSNDHWPQCSRMVYHLIVSPQTQPGSTILNDLGCSDVDLGSNGELEYTLGDNELLAIDRNEGRLTLMKTLESTSYHVPITVQDRGTPSFSISVLIVIDVQEPPHSMSLSISGSDYSTLLESEGLNNAVTITLHDISLILWDSTEALVDFQKVVADIVTKYCAILPEACSLITGCAQFYGTRNRRSIENNYANFPQANIMVISNDTREIPSSASSGAGGTIALEIRFYVILPSNAERAPYRETDYVVPRATLSEIISQDKEVIEAFVRNSLSPPLTPKAVHHVDGWQVTGISFSVLFSVIVVALILVGVRKFAISIKQKTSNRVVPIKKSHSKREKTIANGEWNSKRSASTQPNMSRTRIQMPERKTQPTRVPTRPKVMNTSFTSNGGSRRKREQPTANCRSPWHRLGAKESPPSDDVSPQPTEISSTLSRSSSLDHDRASMENNASSRGRHSTSSDLDSSMPSNLSGSLRDSGDRPGSEDYLDNFPYAPPNRKPIPNLS